MTTTVTPDRDAAIPELQQRVSRNISYLIWRDGTSGRRLAPIIGLAPSGVSQRMTGAVMWDMRDLDKVAHHFHVPAWWLFLAEQEFVQKCTARDLNSQPADSLHRVVSRLAAGVRPSTVTSASPRAAMARVDLLRPAFGTGASSPRAA